MTSRHIDLLVFQIQDAITLLELDGYAVWLTAPDASNRAYLYAENDTETVAITSFEVES